MFCKRKVSDRFSPIVNKENNNLLNYAKISLEKTDCPKSSTFTLTTHMKRNQRPIQKSQYKLKRETNTQSARQFCFQTLKKPTSPQDIPATQCSPISPQTSKSQSVKLQPFKIDFSASHLPSSEQKQQSGWKFEIIQVLQCDDLHYQFQQPDEQIEQWHRRFQHYDMQSDKENLPDSEGEDSCLDSDDDQDQQTGDQEHQIQLQRKQKPIPRYSLMSIIKKKLEQIQQLPDQTSIANPILQSINQ